MDESISVDVLSTENANIITKDKMIRKTQSTNNQMKSSNFTNVNKGVDFTNVNKGVDFTQLAKEHGYIKARQMLKLDKIVAHQSIIQQSEERVRMSYQSARVKEAIRLSGTLGEPSSLSNIEKIIAITNSSEQLNKTNDPNVIKSELDADNALKRTLLNSDGILLIPQSNLSTIPVRLGDTLFMQTAFIKTMSLPRNSLTSFISNHLPQLSCNHFRYITELNLSDNKITSLPFDIGSMKQLSHLNISRNLLSKLPNTLSQMKSLTILNLCDNKFSDIPYEIGTITSITELDLSTNQFTKLPAMIAKLYNIKKLNISDNLLPHLGILPNLHKPTDLWKQVIDLKTGHRVYVNIITKEKYRSILKYNLSTIENISEINVFQSKNNRKDYNMRKLWLSICQIFEWEPVLDIRSGWLYYRNNVSGETQWDMPDDIDQIYNLKNLEILLCNNNNLRLLPNTLIKCTKLRHLSINNNRLHELPSNISNLVNLDILSCYHNELKLLPTAICNNIKLKELYLQSNQLIRLPDNIGSCINLEKIDLSNNLISILSYSMGYLTNIKELLLFENPLTIPPIDEISKGIKHILWYLRNYFLLTKYNKPPMMKFHEISILNEVTLLKPDYINRINHLIQLGSKSPYIVNLQYMGIVDIPEGMSQLTYIRRLQLDYNYNMQLPSGIPTELSVVKSLSMKSCKLINLPNNIDNLRKLHTLNCSMNMIELLPESFTRLKSLTNLDISKNKLVSLPDGMNELIFLKTLNIESNNIEELPNNLSVLTNLIKLNLSSNRLIDFPESLCKGLSNCKVLNLDKNKLYNLPFTFRHMDLVELRIGHNKIEYLTENLFAYELGKSIKYFSCNENNLLDLPNSLHLISKECYFECDYNPLRSPPSYMLNDSLEIIQKYLKYRQIRLEELEELLELEDFVFIRGHTKPYAYEVLDDGLGFLTPEDLIEFDLAIDEYINHEYFKCPATAEEIVKGITVLREERENGLYLSILETFIGVLDQLLKEQQLADSENNDHKDHKRRRDKSKNIIYPQSVLFEAQRPWGRQGEQCGVFVVSLQSLLKDLAPNRLTPTGRPSILSHLIEALPLMPFPFTIELLKDCLRLYLSPYGQVADTERVIFPYCDCFNERTNKPVNHVRCEKPAVVIVKTIYRDDEAMMRDIEEDEYMIQFEAIDNDIQLWLNTDEGKKQLDKEVTKRRAHSLENLRLREEMVVIEGLKLINAQNNLKKLQKRKYQMENSAPFEVHQFLDMDDAIKQIAVEENKIVRCANREDALKQLIVKLKEELKLELKDRRIAAIDDITEKYCALNYQNTVHICRKYAYKHNLRRPWDGLEGSAYNDWLRGYVDNPDNTTDLPLDKQLEIESERENKLDYNWDNTNNMEKFKTELYGKYLLKKEKDNKNILNFMKRRKTKNKVFDMIADIEKQLK